MRWFPFVLVAVAAVLLQAGLMPLVEFGDAFPDLLVALLVSFALGVGPAEGFAAGAVLGLGRDLFSKGPFGLGMAVSAILGWLVSRRRPVALGERFPARAVFGFLCSVAMSLALLLPDVVEGCGPAWGFVARRTLLTAVSTSVLAALVGALVWRKARWFGLRRRSEFADV
ncbi:MAG TPA: rod shape-determining protein MreD [Planctomycetota bacterium]|nr:rod shape-determining protein MreD [Planctomycetota bacterium]